MTASDHVRVVLEDVVTKLTGVYLCEVTITPTFYAMAESANMTVIGEMEDSQKICKISNRRTVCRQHDHDSDRCDDTEYDRMRVIQDE